ncbi:MAG TPA: hypothetical protein VJ044_06905 [Candidatus Hodarchaeales archaeon]|nr:hypothetical protein [Candidatus Hodarchaeales archaeon]
MNWFKAIAAFINVAAESYLRFTDPKRKAASLRKEKEKLLAKLVSIQGNEPADVNLRSSLNDRILRLDEEIARIERN